MPAGQAEYGREDENAADRYRGRRPEADTDQGGHSHGDQCCTQDDHTYTTDTEGPPIITRKTIVPGASGGLGWDERTLARRQARVLSEG